MLAQKMSRTCTERGDDGQVISGNLTAHISVSPEAVRILMPQTGANVEQTPKSKYSEQSPGHTSLEQSDDNAAVQFPATVTLKKRTRMRSRKGSSFEIDDLCDGDPESDHTILKGKQAAIAVVKAPATTIMKSSNRMRSSDGSSVEIHHNDGLQNDDQESDPEAKQAAAEASSNDTVQQDPAPELKLGKRPIRKWSKRWWRRKFADLWYIIRKEHVLVGIMVPLHEELAVLTRLQGLLCFYVEIELALAAGGLFVGTTQTATNAGLVAILSIVVVSPASLLIPYVFTVSQTLVSTTVLISRQNRRTDSARTNSSSSVGMHTIVKLLMAPKKSNVVPSLAVNMLREKRKDAQFRRAVRVAELDYYVKNLHHLRDRMLALSYCTLTFFLLLALSKLVLPERSMFFARIRLGG